MSFAAGVNAQIELVKDINPNGNGVGGLELVVYKNELYFTGIDDSPNSELWKSDGTEEGTVMVKDLVNTGGAGPFQLTVAGDYLYFSGNTNLGTSELYRTDGTYEGTAMVVDQRDGLYDPDIRNLVAVGNKLFFTGSDGTSKELYMVEGTGTPVRLSDFKSSQNSVIIGMTAFKDRLFFSATSDTDGAGREMYVSDGTPAGTKLFKDLYPGDGNSSYPNGFSAIGDLMFFSARDEAGREPWVSDGTPGGTYRLTDLNNGAISSNPGQFTGSTTSKVFFTADDGTTGAELFITDGTVQGTLPVKDIWTEPGASANLRNLTLADDGLYFTAWEPETWNELWYSDGTPEGTFQVTDLYEGEADGVSIQDNSVFWYNGVVYFAGDDGTVGEEVWAVIDSTGTVTLVQDYYTNQSSSYPGNFVTLNDTIFFFGNDFNGRELRKMAPLNAGDPCDGIICPVGQVCLDGMCYDPSSIFEGTIIDATTDQPLEGAEIIQLQGSDTIQVVHSDSDGNYSMIIENEYNTSLLVSLNPYISSSRNVSIMRMLKDYDILLSTDPCFDVLCPVGEVCLDGSCYKPLQPVNGIVYDQDNNPVAGARVEDLNMGKSTQTSINGSFTIDTTWNSVIILKEGYSPRYEIIKNQSALEIYLNFDPCYNKACEAGQACVGGECFGPYDTVYAAFSIHDASGGNIESVIEVTELGTSTTYMAEGFTEIPLVTRRPLLIFHDPQGNYHDAIIPFVAGKDVYTLESAIDCEDINCPVGETCYMGACYSPNPEIAPEDRIMGHVIGNSGLPLPYTTVSSAISESVVTDRLGYFEIAPIYPVDSLNLRFEKPGFGSISVTCYPGIYNRIFTTFQNTCYNTECPEGYFCLDGQCFPAENAPGSGDPDSCANVWCPVGEVCYDGSCYTPCELTPEVCAPPDTEPCEGIMCPVGQTCYEGACYEPCSHSEAVQTGCSGYADPCDGVTVPPGYICSNGTLLPDCPMNTLACGEPNPCSVIRCGPDEICFQCFDESGYNTSGTSVLMGTLDLGSLKSVDVPADGTQQDASENGVFIYLIDSATDRKVAIARTDNDGSFHFENIPAADYLLFAVLPGYLITSDEQLINVEENQELQVDITSENEFLQVAVTEVLSASKPMQQTRPSWYPSPNREGRFFLDHNGSIEKVKLYNATGAEMRIQLIHSPGNGTAELSMKQAFDEGVYFIRWKTSNDPNTYSQTLIIQ